MKHIKTFESFSVNEEFWGFSAAEKAEKAAALEADKKRLADQFNELKDKLTNKDYTLEQALESAEEFGDDFKGNFELVRGGRRGETFLTYAPAKSKNWFQGKTGGSSGFGTAHG